MLTAVGECNVTTPGFYATAGSTEQKPCYAGTVAPNIQMPTCQQCAEGKFQNETGQQTCRPCTPGYFCAAGSSAPLPCPAGTRMDLTVMTSANDCITCGEGTFCPVGSESATECSAGTNNDQPGQETCAKCAPGKYQPQAGATRGTPGGRGCGTRA